MKKINDLMLALGYHQGSISQASRQSKPAGRAYLTLFQG
jgi:hypothetical protein